MNKISRDEVLASSSGWVASLLNFLPGIGSGYLYQRRWLPYFLTAGSVSAWFAIGIILSFYTNEVINKLTLSISVLKPFLMIKSVLFVINFG